MSPLGIHARFDWSQHDIHIEKEHFYLEGWHVVLPIVMKFVDDRALVSTDERFGDAAECHEHTCVVFHSVREGLVQFHTSFEYQTTFALIFDNYVYLLFGKHRKVDSGSILAVW